MKKFIETIIRKAGNTALGYFKKSGLKYAHKKNVADVVTEADHASNRVLLSAIKKRFPTHGIISEETGEEHKDAEYVWIVDPLDGTRNFFTHTPLWGVMVGLARKKQMIAAAIYDPNHNELVYAERGKGAFLNGKRVHCSRTRTLLYSYGATTAIMKSDRMHFLLRIGKMVRDRGEIWVNNFGSAAIPGIAVSSGRRDWLIASGEKVWDRAIPALIYREAGCRVTDFNGKPWRLGFREIVAANPRLHKQLLQILK